jgi:hypothetical protein
MTMLAARACWPATTSGLQASQRLRNAPRGVTANGREREARATTAGPWSATTLDLYTRRSDGEDRILRALAGDNDDKEEPW